MAGSRIESAVFELYGRLWLRQNHGRVAASLDVAGDGSRSDLEDRGHSQKLRRRELLGVWFASGAGLDGHPSNSGEFAIEPGGDRVLTGIYPAGAYSHGLSTKPGQGWRRGTLNWARW